MLHCNEYQPEEFEDCLQLISLPDSKSALIEIYFMYI